MVKYNSAMANLDSVQDAVKTSFLDSYDVLSSSQTSERGVLRSSAQLVQEVIKNRYDGLKISDFALSNLVALGKMPQNPQYCVSSNFKTLDNIS